MSNHPTAQRTPFPKDFLWGCATSAYQIEGSPLADGAGPSIWHRFAHTPGQVHGGDTADVACDHYRRWREDIELMRELRLNAYRFSIAWSRVLPQGTGRLNAAGLGFYERLVDGLLAQGIQPMATLFHWDLPAALEDRGGWLNPEAPEWFAAYAEQLFRRLDDRVTLWTTLNEPWVVTDGGYLHGILAPGHRNRYEAPIAAHHLLLAHGAAVQAYRASGRHRIGVAINLEPKYPASAGEDDMAAARRAHAYMNRQFLDPILRGAYPDELREIFADAWPRWERQDMERIRQPIDYVGVNYYTRSVVKFDAQAWPLRAAPVFQAQHTHTQTGWEVFPQGLTDTLLWIKQRYDNPPLYITENGAAFYDPPTLDQARVPCDRIDTRMIGNTMMQEAGTDRAGLLPASIGTPHRERAADDTPAPESRAAGRAAAGDDDASDTASGSVLDDPLRVDYLRQHLRAVQAALECGVDIRGYFAWSLLDNFEWAHGFSKRFGIVHVDYATLQRTPKASARFYTQVIRTHGAALYP